MENTLNIMATKPVAPWLGGKSRLAKTIIPRISATAHEIYAEPFVGMGGVFLRRTAMAKSEIINDRNQEITTFFRILQRHYVPFLEMFKFQLTTRADFIRLVNTNPETLTDLERSARFLYLQRTAFGGKVSGHNFGVSPDRPARFDITKLTPMLEDLHTRMSRVVIECLDWSKFIERYDRPETLFYLDPPYHGCENDYGKGLFDRGQFEIMASQLSGIKGKFILSLNDTPEIRALFAGFNIEAVETKYSVGKSGRSKKIGEVLISNT